MLGLREQFDVDVEIEELREACDGVLLALIAEHVTGRSGGAPADIRFAMVWTVRGNKIVHVLAYLDRSEALAAVTRMEKLVETAKTLYSSYGRRDRDTLFAGLDPDFEWDLVPRLALYWDRERAFADLGLED